MAARDGMPRPDDLGRAPLWELYVVVQATQASLGIVPEHTLAFGVVVNGLHVELCWEVTEVTDADLVDLDDIEDGLDEITGHILEVSRRIEVRQQRSITPSGSPVWWLYLARVPDDEVSDEVTGRPSTHVDIPGTST